MRLLIAISLFMVTHLAAEEWSSVQGNSAHTGFLNVPSDASKFRKVWTLPLAENEYIIEQPLLTDTMVFFSIRREINPSSFYVFTRAVNIATGKVVWEQDWYSNALYYADGELFDVSAGILYAYVAETGNLKYTLRLADDNGGYRTAIFATKDTLYVATGEHIQAFNRKNLQLKWTKEELYNDNDAPQLPAVDGRFIAEVTHGGIDLYNTKTGRHLANIDSGGYLLSFAMNVPVLDTHNKAVYNCFRQPDTQYLFAFDLETRKIKWKVPNKWGQVAVAGDEVYAYNWGDGISRIDALDALTGTLKWSWSPPAEEKLYFWPGPVITQDHIFVPGSSNGSSNGSSQVYALSRTDHKLVWSTPATEFPYLALGKDFIIIGTTAYRLH